MNIVTDVLQGMMLLFLELVLVVDNALIIVLMCAGLPAAKRALGERLAIGQGALLRVVLIFFMGWLLSLAKPVPVMSDWLVQINGHELTWTGLIRIVGGLVLVGMAAHHISEEWKPAHAKKIAKASSIFGVLSKTFFVSIIFSVDSVMSAVGAVDNLWVAGIAVGLAAVAMMFFVGKISSVMAKLPDLKTLGLAFVLFIGGILIIEGVGYHVPKLLIYVPLLFAILVQSIDILRRRARGPIGMPETQDKLLAQLSTEDLRKALDERERSVA